MLRALFGPAGSPAPCRYLGNVVTDADASLLNLKRLPEIAVVGRSNVGKSSVINGLVKMEVARCSKTPGRTRKAHMFSLGEKAILVDLPGYSFAKGSEEDLEAMSSCISELALLRGDKSSLARVLLLSDSRRGGLMPADWQMLMALKEKGIGFDVVLTKIDRLKKPASVALVKEMGLALSAYESTVVGTSAHDDLGMDTLRGLIANRVETFEKNI